MEKPTVSQLVAEAAKRLQTEFEFARTSLTPGERGVEVEGVLREFLNSHLPQRFRCNSGFIIDNENQTSAQTDVLIYDALASPVYRYSEKSLIIPADTVAAVIEVKTCLTKAEMADAYKKIGSCKSLKKRRFSPMDIPPTGSPMSTVGTMGIVFAFDSQTSLDSLAGNMAELNQSCASRTWPDMVVVLNKGVINFGASFPGANAVLDLAPPCDEDFQIPPFYVYLMCHSDGDFALHRFFTYLLAHLTFFPHRPSTPPFATILQGACQQAQIAEAYQFTTKRDLRPVPLELRGDNIQLPKTCMVVKDSSGRIVGELERIPWQDGAVLRWRGTAMFAQLLPVFLPNQLVMGLPIPNSKFVMSTVVSVTEAEFLGWPELLTKRSNLSGTILPPSP